MVEQLRYFPHGRYDDALDALQIAVSAYEKSSQMNYDVMINCLDKIKNMPAKNEKGYITNPVTGQIRPIYDPHGLYKF